MSPTRILLVEDNPGDAFLVRSLLELQGEPQDESQQFHLTHVDSLGQGLSALAENDFDVVLLDLHLPDSYGIEGLSQLREQAPKLPVVVLTSLDDEALSIQLVQLGAQDYLIKDKITQDWLKTTINHAIARSQRSKVQDQHGQALHQTNQALQGRVLDYRNKLN